ncbi:hypothetical protein, partial [Arthrobacter pascens]|uniref:hypothetical protein n=1 Tax=Arthrobacter pascens TaxID=1677 RepID=UPI00196B0B74
MKSATAESMAAMNDVEIAASFNHWATSLVDGAQTRDWFSLIHCASVVMNSRTTLIGPPSSIEVSTQSHRGTCADVASLRR